MLGIAGAARYRTLRQYGLDAAQTIDSSTPDASNTRTLTDSAAT